MLYLLLILFVLSIVGTLYSLRQRRSLGVPLRLTYFHWILFGIAVIVWLLATRR